MRLDAREQTALQSALAGVEAEAVYLFGSRADDQRAGGDIDLLVFSSDNAFELSRKIASRFFMECEEKVDVVVMNPAALSSEQQVFLNLLRQGKMERIR